MKYLVVIFVAALLAGCKSTIKDAPPSPTNSADVITMPVETVSIIGKAGFLVSNTETDSVTISCSPSTSPNIVAYNLYRGATSGNYPEKLSFGAAPSAIIQFVLSDSISRYFFVMTAVNSDGLESDYSPESHWPPYDPITVGLHLTPSAAGMIYTLDKFFRLASPFTNSTVSGVDVPLNNALVFCFYGVTNGSLNAKPILYYPQ